MLSYLLYNLDSIYSKSFEHQNAFRQKYDIMTVFRLRSISSIIDIILSQNNCQSSVYFRLFFSPSFFCKVDVAMGTIEERKKIYFGPSPIKISNIAIDRINIRGNKKQQREKCSIEHSFCF
jgi:hypothetical protein